CQGDLVLLQRAALIARKVGDDLLLRGESARHERPRHSAAEQRDELAPPHSITSSAATWRVSGIVSPSALAVLRFIMSSNLVGCMTGKSAGFSPLRIRPV